MLSSLQSSHLQQQAQHPQGNQQQTSKFQTLSFRKQAHSGSKSPWFGGQGGFISVNFVQFVLNSINLETKQVGGTRPSLLQFSAIPLPTSKLVRSQILNCCYLFLKSQLVRKVKFFEILISIEKIGVVKHIML